MKLEDYRLPAEKLRWKCDPRCFDFECTDQLTPLHEFIGQDRAIKAIEFGLAVEKPGYNIFVTGLTGTGKASAVKAHLEGLVSQAKMKAGDDHPDDWCYIYNLTTPDRPKALRLPQGKGRTLRDDMEKLLARIQTDIPKVFSSEDYSRAKQEIVQEGQAKHRQFFQDLEKEALEEGFALQASPVGLLLLPMIQDKPATPEEFMALKKEERDALESKREALMKRVESTLQAGQALEKEAADKVRLLDEKVAEIALAPLFQELLSAYQSLPEVVQYIQEAKSFTLTNINIFREPETAHGQTPQAMAGLPSLREKDPFLAFRVNVFIDNSQTAGPPIILETNPTYGNLFGKIERRPVMGAYFTDHTLLKPGAFALANGGYLVLNARDVLLNPGAWESLKRTIKNKEVRLEDPFEQFGLMAPHGLRPQPIPLRVKVVLMGDHMIYNLISLYDEDSWEIFKVKADFDSEIDRTKENLDAFASFVCACCQSEGLLHFDPSAVAKVAEYAARSVANQEKMTARFGQIKDLLIEADYWAREKKAPRISGEHVQQAIKSKIYRSNLIEERIRELMAEGTLMVDVSGAVVGQVNGLSVYSLGDLNFGRPTRITAQTFMGRAGVINIERESQLSGPIHNKGVLILTGYLGWKYAQDKPLSLSTSLCFEQSYDGVEGDSASSTELYAILSGLADIPLKQNIAVTGSVNQKGEIQPIGGANQKIEGFFDVCKTKGFTGDQGVMIPHQNIRHLMLREDVVEAAANRQFHIYAVKTIDEGIEVLTGVEAGERGPDGTYPEGGINQRVDKRLRELAQGMRAFASSETKNQKD